MKNENKLVFSFGTMDKKKLKTYFDFLRKIHSARKQIVDVDLSKNAIAKMKFYEELQKNIHFISNDKKQTIFGSFFSSFASVDDTLDAKLFINNEVADLFFDLPEKDFLYRPLRSKYAKLICNKLSKSNGADDIITVSRNEIIYDWGIDTDAKMSQFILRLPLYVDEINSSGILDGELNFSIARASEKKQSRIVAVLFHIDRAEKVETTMEYKNKRPLKSPQSDEMAAAHTETPTAKQYTKEDEGTLLCPKCGGKIVHCTTKSGKAYECCEHSLYNINTPASERGKCKGYYKEL